jgi:hypothetical protein
MAEKPFVIPKIAMAGKVMTPQEIVAVLLLKSGNYPVVR